MNQQLTTVTGVIQNIHYTANKYKDKQGNEAPLCSFTIKGVDGWFRLGTRPCNYAVGTPVTFQASPTNQVRSLQHAAE